MLWHGWTYKVVHDIPAEHQWQIAKVVHLRQKVAEIKCTEVEHKTLKREVRSALQQVKASDRAQMTPSRITAQGEKRHTVLLLRIVDQPLSDIEAVFITSRIRILRRQAIANRNDDQIEVARDPVEKDVLRVLAVQHPTSTMDMVEDPFRLDFSRLEETAGDLSSGLAGWDLYVLAVLEALGFGKCGLASRSHFTVFGSADLVPLWAFLSNFDQAFVERFGLVSDGLGAEFTGV